MRRKTSVRQAQMKIGAAFLLATGAALLACAEKNADETRPSALETAPPLIAGHEPAAPAAGGASDPHAGLSPGAPGGPLPQGELQWKTPAGWTAESPSNPMRRAQYRLPAAGGDPEDGECVVFYFGPGQGGDAPANVARWVSQFTTPEGGKVVSRVSSQRLPAGVVTRVEAEGIYHPMAVSFGGAPPPPKPGYRLLGAIVPGADANWFFRCTGPERTIQSGRRGFEALLASIE